MSKRAFGPFVTAPAAIAAAAIAAFATRAPLSATNADADLCPHHRRQASVGTDRHLLHALQSRGWPNLKVSGVGDASFGPVEVRGIWSPDLEIGLCLDLILRSTRSPTARRVEVITVGSGRRRWSNDEKPRTVEAASAPHAIVSQVARRYGATPQQLFTWRREVRQRAPESTLPEAFVPVIVEPGAAPRSSTGEANKLTPARPHSIELDVDGASVFIWRDADPAMVTAIIGALQAAK